MSIMASQLPSNPRSQVARDSATVRAHVSSIELMSEADRVELFDYVLDHTFGGQFRYHDVYLIRRAFHASSCLSYSQQRLILCGRR